MRITDTNIEAVKIIEPDIFSDKRGLFYESFNKAKFDKYFQNYNFVQDNFSESSKNILRGLHFQKSRPQGKLVSCTFGEVFDVAVDINPKSKSFGSYVSVILSSKNKKQLWIPPGFAHGFVALSEKVHFQYKCTEYYDPKDEAGIIWNDEDLKINWPVSNPIVSDKDLENYKLSEYLKKI